jgi:hypothetical protein
MKSIDYLQMMGISTWRLRAVNAANYYCYQFYNDEELQPIGLMLAVNLVNDAEKQLVDAIAKAVKKRFVSECVATLNFADFTQIRVVILLGEQLAETVTASVGELPIIVSYSPAELLANPNLKAKTWEEIKKAIRMMG